MQSSALGLGWVRGRSAHAALCHGIIHPVNYNKEAEGEKEEDWEERGGGTWSPGPPLCCSYGHLHIQIIIKPPEGA